MNAHTAAQLDERWQINTRANAKRLALKERALAFLGGKCHICGYCKCPAALDFHHMSGKEFSISSKSSWKRIEAELLKCVLLCSNCHREVHAGWHPEYLLATDDD
jgi:hypothetical protein